MREFDYRLEHFEENCRFLAGKKVFLYGTGANAKAVLERFDAYFCFRGVISPDPGGETGCRGTAPDAVENNRPGRFFGKPVVSLEEALGERPDLILLAANMYSAEQIYQRIKRQVREAGVKLSDMYGIDPDVLHEELEKEPFRDYSDWLKKTEGYDVVSFEVKDTLVEQDLFDSRDGRVRPVFRRLIPELRDRGSRVLLIMSPDQDQEMIRRILKDNGLFNDGMLKESLCIRNWKEEFFREVAGRFPGKKLLHIGCSMLENGIMPRLCGFDTCRMVFFDRKRLTAFLKETCPEGRHGEEVPDSISRHDFLAAMEGTEAVSFDIFDTLLIRQTSHPSDVFLMTAERALKNGILKDENERQKFLSVRLLKQSAEKSFDVIYGEIGSLLGMDEDRLLKLKAEEIKTEELVLAARPDVGELLEEAVNTGRRVILVSDMYFSSAFLEKLLYDRGIRGFGKVYVSCEYGICKRDGLLAIAADDLGKAGVLPSAILHVGDSDAHDRLPSAKAGLRFFKVPSVQGSSEEADDIVSVDTRDLARRLFFGLRKTFRYRRGVSSGDLTGREKDLYRYGALAMAPVVIGWLSWLGGMLRDIKADAILFAARDGYILKELYEEEAGPGNPRAVYFYTSRKSAFLLSCDRSETTGFISGMTEGLSAGKALRQIFDIDPGVPGGDDTAGNDTDLGGLLAEFDAAVKKRAEQARTGYARYCEEESLKAGKTYIFVDFVAAGTSQRLLEEASPFALKGVCFGRTPGAPQHNCDIRAFIRTDGSEQEQAFLDRYLEMEYYMTSPEPSFKGFGGAGEKMFEPEIRTPRELSEIEIVQRGVKDFVRQYRRLLKGVGRAGRLSDPLWFRNDASGGLFTSSEVCAMYLEEADGGALQRYYDDWSGEWL